VTSTWRWPRPLHSCVFAPGSACGWSSDSTNAGQRRGHQNHAGNSRGGARPALDLAVARPLVRGPASVHRPGAAKRVRAEGPTRPTAIRKGLNESARCATTLPDGEALTWCADPCLRGSHRPEGWVDHDKAHPLRSRRLEPREVRRPDFGARDADRRREASSASRRTRRPDHPTARDGPLATNDAGPNPLARGSTHACASCGQLEAAPPRRGGFSSWWRRLFGRTADRATIPPAGSR
jgi:hypothetical protein